MKIQGRVRIFLGLAMIVGVVSTAGLAHLRAQMAPFQALATIPSTCSVSAADINFGVYDPVVANLTQPKDAEGLITLTCTSGLTPVLSLMNQYGTATGTLGLYNGNTFLTFDLYKDAARTQRINIGDEIARPTDFLVNGGTVVLTVYARLLPGQMQARSGDLYTAQMNVSMVY